MFDYYDEPTPSKPWNPGRPIIGMAICVCLFVAGVLLTFYVSCGSEGSSSGTDALLEIAVFGPMIGFVACVVWLIVGWVRSMYRK